MLHDTCPNCGYRNKPYMMQTCSDSSLREIWNGEDGLATQVLIKVGFVLIAALILVGIVNIIHI